MIVTNLSEAIYMLSGDTTVYPSILLENTNVKKHLQNYCKGLITYDELLSLTYEEF